MEARARRPRAAFALSFDPSVAACSRLADLVANSQEQVAAQLQAVLDADGAGDPRWVLTLDDIDEPPLFSRAEDVEVLRGVPRDRRGPILLALALGRLRGIAELVATIAHPLHRTFACVTVTDFDLVLDETQAVATMAIQVDPRDDERAQLAGFLPGDSAEAAEVRGWLVALGSRTATEFVVGELAPTPAPELRRVYVGFRHSASRAFRSVGDYMSHEEPRRG